MRNQPEASGPTVEGFTAPGFERVRDAFRANFERHGDVGAACCAYLHGRPVVDLHGGLADPETRRPWDDDTLAVVFSTTKGATAIAAHLLVERGRLDLDRPVADYWPEFAANGKGAIPVRWLLCHKAGLAAVDGNLTLDEVLAWEPVVRALAAQAPNWEPGTAHGYHARSYGWLIGEVIGRVTGKSAGRFFAEEIAAPLGIDFWIGLPEREEPRVARMLPAPPPDAPGATDLLAVFERQDMLLGRVMTGPSNLFRYDDMWNRRDLHAAEMPSSNGIASARAIARLYAATIGEVDGVRLLAADTVERACAPEADGSDRVLIMPTRFGTGFMLPPALSRAAGPRAFGHPGAGGSLGLADPERGLAFGYVMNQMQFGLTGDPRSETLLRAVYDAIA